MTRPEVQEVLDLFLKPGATVEEMCRGLRSLAAADAAEGRSPTSFEALFREGLSKGISEALVKKGIPLGETWELVFAEDRGRGAWGAIVKVDGEEVRVGLLAERVGWPGARRG